MSIDRYKYLIQAGLRPTLDACIDPEQPEEWARLCFFVVFRLYRMVHKWRYKIGSAQEALKEDGSPYTSLELEMEEFAKKTLRNFHKDANFLGEESGGDVNPEKFLFIIDPVDGTRSFLSGFDTYSITLSVLRNYMPIVSLVCIPASGDTYVRLGKSPSILFQAANASEGIHICQLPLITYSPQSAILVNLHPSRTAHGYIEQLFSLWDNNKISLVRSVSGSPSLFMVEAAKTGTFYINTWMDAPTRPYDLIPALDIVKGTGAVVLASKGKAVDPWRHKGTYVVGPKGPGLDLLLSVIA